MIFFTRKNIFMFFLLPLLFLTSCTYELGHFAAKEEERVIEDAVEEFASEQEHEMAHGKECKCGARITSSSRMTNHER
jgi:hypothetical protein